MAIIKSILAWVKKNVIFVICMVVGSGLTGFCAYLMMKAMSDNEAASTEYTTQKAALDALLQKSPSPSKENIQSVNNDEQKIRQFLVDFRKRFANFPIPPKKDNKEFKVYLDDCMLRFRGEATNAGVLLPQDYGFDFSGLMGRLNYSPTSISNWMVQMEEMNGILNVLYQAKINALLSLCRVPVSPDDTPVGTDCILPAASQAAPWGVTTPYTIQFRGFSEEIAAVMEGFARSSNCFIIKTIDIEEDSSVPSISVPTTSQPGAVAPSEGIIRRGPPGGPRTAAPAATAVAGTAAGPPVLILSELPLKVNMAVDVVILKTDAPAAAKKAASKAAKPKTQAP